MQNIPSTPGTARGDRLKLAGFYFCYFAFLGTFGTYFALYLQSRGYSAGQIAFLLSLQQIVRIAAPYAWGWLADHLHRRAAIIRVTLALATLAYAALFFVSDYSATVLVFAVMFLFWSAALPLFEAIVIGATEGDSGRYARVRLWGSVGFIVAVTSAGALLDRIAIDNLLWMVLVLLAAAVLASLLVREPRPAPRDSTAPAAIWPVLKRPAVLALFAACFLMMASQSATFVFYSIHMVASGHSKSAVGVLWSTGVVAEIAVFLLLPRLNRRFAPTALFMTSYAMTALRFLLVGWFPQSFLLQMIAQSLHAFTFGTWHAAAMAMVHRLFPGRLATRGQALYTSFSFGVGGATGGLVAGLAWERIGPSWTFTLMSVFAAIGWGVAARLPRES